MNLKQYRGALLAGLLALALSACSQPQDQTAVPAPPVPTSPYTGVETTTPELTASEAATSVTEVANEEVTVSPETIDAAPEGATQTTTP